MMMLLFSFHFVILKFMPVVTITNSRDDHAAHRHDYHDPMDRLLCGQNQILKLIWSGADVSYILHELTLFIESIIPDSLCSVMLLSADRQQLLSAAAPHLDPEYCRTVNGVAVHPTNGSCGRAAATGEMVIATDLETDPLWENYRDLTRRFQLRSCWSQPVVSKHGIVLGTFATYSSQPRTPTPRDLEVLEFSARLAAIATESQHNERELSAKERRFQALVEQSFDAIMTMDTQGHFRYDSPSACRIMGYPDGFYLGKHFREFVHPRDLDLANQLLEFLLSHPQGSFNNQRLRALNNAGEYRWIEVSGRNLLADDNVKEIILNWRDIHQSLQFEEQLRLQQLELAHAARQLTMAEMVAGISHEINQPLYAIKNFATALLTKSSETTWPGMPKALDWLKEIIQQSERAGEILDRLRNFVKKHPNRQSVLKPNEVVIEAVKLLEPDAKFREVPLVVELPDQTETILGDRILLQQVLVNLIQNSIDATLAAHRHSPVIISVRQVPGFIKFQVADQGIGLGNADIGRVFEPFYTTKTSGMGLGLTICRSIIESLRGSICAEPNHPQGACFSFQIPIHVTNLLLPIADLN
jgi:PAS domain S-box-containing protein